MQSIRWEIDLGALIGQRVWVETHDGFVRRSDRLTNIGVQPMMIQGVLVDLPVSIMLEGDSIPFSQVKVLRLRESHE